MSTFGHMHTFACDASVVGVVVVFIDRSKWMDGCMYGCVYKFVHA